MTPLGLLGPRQCWSEWFFSPYSHCDIGGPKIRLKKKCITLLYFSSSSSLEGAVPSVYFRMYNYNLGIFVPMKNHYISHIWPWHHYFNWFPPFLLYSERDNIICTPNETRASHNSGVHVLLVSLFGIPIVRSISQFFGRPNFFLVYQIFFWSTKLFFLVNQISCWYTKLFFWYTKLFFGIPNFSWSTKKMRNWPYNWYTKETDQKYMDAANS